MSHLKSFAADSDPEDILYIVDDDPAARKSMAALAASMKIKCESFASAEELLERHDASMIGCALIDYRLGGMDGLQLLARLRAVNSMLAVIVISGQADVALAVLAMKSGAFSVIEKPYRQDDLAEAIRDALRHSRQAWQSRDERMDDRLPQRNAFLVYDLHDGAAQYLSAAIMELERYERCRGVRPDAARAAFQNVQGLVARSLEEVRGLIQGWHIITGAQSVAEIVGRVVSDFRDRLEIELIHGPVSASPNMELAAAIYRIVQESLTNVCRHSKSQKARIEVREGDGQVYIDIKDWGIGFDDREVGPGKFGLLGVRQRAIALAGEVRVTSACGHGTCVSVCIPVARDMPG